MAEQTSAIVKAKNWADEVLVTLDDMQTKGKVSFPANYSLENAMQAAYLYISKVVDKNKDSALVVCSKASVAAALLDMAIQGLNVAKKQGYFVVYGKELVFLRSYFGTRTVLKRLGLDVDAMIIWEGDEFEREVTADHKYRVTKHVSPWENHGGSISGAYAVIKDVGTGEELYTEIMNWNQIQESWKHSKTFSYANSTHKEHPDDMTKRTITEKSIKGFVNTRDDADLLIGAFNRSTEDRYENDKPIQKIAIDPFTTEAPALAAPKVVVPVQVNPNEPPASGGGVYDPNFKPKT